MLIFKKRKNPTPVVELGSFFLSFLVSHIIPVFHWESNPFKGSYSSLLLGLQIQLLGLGLGDNYNYNYMYFFKLIIAIPDETF